MRVYLAALKQNYFEEFMRHFPNRKLNVLISYNSSFKDIRKCYFCKSHVRDKINSLIIDAGTYTQYRKRQSTGLLTLTSPEDGKNVTFDKYVKFLDSLEEKDKLPDHYVNYDIDFRSGEKAFNINKGYLEKLNDNGFDPIPVIHDLDRDTEYLLKDSNKYPIIGVGSSNKLVGLDGINNINEKERIEFEKLQTVISQIYNSGRMIHYLGKTVYDLADYPVASCDSATWVISVASGYVLYWNENYPENDKTQKIFINKDEYNEKHSDEEKDDFEKYVKKLNDESEIEIQFDDIFDIDEIASYVLSIYYFGVDFQSRVTEAHNSQAKRFNTNL